MIMQKQMATKETSVTAPVSGFAIRNLHYMRQFAETFSDANWAAAAAQIPWGHNMLEHWIEFNWCV